MHRLVALAALLLLPTACSEQALRARNLVLVSIDTLRADKLGSYGYDRPTSPTLDALAEGGVLFEAALTTSPWTLPAHASLLTGLYPSRHGVDSDAFTLSKGVATLAEILGGHGFDTAAIVNSHHLSQRFDLDRGFAHFRYAGEFPMAAEPSLVEGWALEWIAAEPREPFFLFLHFYDVHSDYRSTAEYEELFTGPYTGRADGSTLQLALFRRGRFELGASDAKHFEDLYVAGIRQLDDGIARLLAALERAGLRDDTLVIVTSDHGEEFLEHGSVLHGRTSYAEVLRVPLILNGPGLPAGLQLAGPASIIDVLPTALSLLGLPVRDGLDGVDLSGAWRGGPGIPEDRLVFAEADHDNAIPDMIRAVRNDRFKLILDRSSGEAKLYDLASDSRESRDASTAHPEVAALLRRKLDAFLALEPVAGRGDPLPAYSDEELDQLQALGYLQRELEAPEAVSP